MFPKSTSIKKSLSREHGFLLPLALFILVVMGLLALTISRTSVQTQTASIQEFTNLQTFYAAESGAQRGMQRLFLDTTNPLTRATVNARCAGWVATINFNGIAGLKICTAEVSCAFTTDAANLISFYTITSKGSCSQDQFRAERTLEVGAYLEQE